MSHDHSSSDTSDDSSMSAMMHGMTPYLHIHGGDALFFKDIAPSSKGAIAGAAIFLFFLAVSERFISAMRSIMEAHWRQRAKTLVERKLYLNDNSNGDAKASQVSLSAPRVTRTRVIPPFIWSHDIFRGAMHALQSLIHFALMLAVMTYQAAYIITIVAGLGVGEVVFGRLSVAEFGAHNH